MPATLNIKRRLKDLEKRILTLKTLLSDIEKVA